MPLEPPDDWTWQQAERYAAKVANRASHGILDWGDVLSVANHAVSKACRHYTSASAFKTFLHRIARQLGQEAAGKESRCGMTTYGGGPGAKRITWVDLPKRIGMEEAELSKSINPSSSLEYEEILSMVCPQTRQILEMVVQGCTVDEIVESLGLPAKNTYCQRMQKARRRLLAAGYEPPRCVAGEPARPKRDRSRVAQGSDRAAGKNKREAA